MKIANLSKLRYLSINDGGSKVTDASLVAIADGCTQLEELDIQRFEYLTGSGIAHLCERNRQLKKLDFHVMNRLTDEDMDRIVRACPLLSSIGLSHSNRLMDASITSLATNCPLLGNVSLTSMDLITDVGMEALALHCPLKEVRIDRLDGITDSSLRSLARHCSQSLTVLDVGQGPVTDAGIRQVVTACSRLELLNVRDCVISEETILLAAASLPNLKELMIEVDLSSPNMLPSLRTLCTNCKQMESVEIYHNGVVEEEKLAIDDLKRDFPHIHFFDDDDGNDNNDDEAH
jgi:hypothetical protein